MENVKGKEASLPITILALKRIKEWKKKTKKSIVYVFSSAPFVGNPIFCMPGRLSYPWEKGLEQNRAVNNPKTALENQARSENHHCPFETYFSKSSDPIVLRRLAVFIFLLSSSSSMNHSQCRTGARVVAHALDYRVLCNVSPGFSRPEIGLTQGVSVQIRDDLVELGFGERRIEEMRKHLPLVRGYVLLVPRISSMTLQEDSTNAHTLEPFLFHWSYNHIKST